MHGVSMAANKSGMDASTPNAQISGSDTVDIFRSLCEINTNFGLYEPN
jgi:hypothetical protein